jgi:hypothetical protein
LLLVKSVSLPQKTDAVFETAPIYSAAELVNQGWVDPVFPTYAARNTCQHWLCGPGGHHGLAESLGEPDHHFLRILT